MNLFLDICWTSINLAFWAATREFVSNSSFQKPVTTRRPPREREHTQWLWQAPEPDRLGPTPVLPSLILGSEDSDWLRKEQETPDRSLFFSLMWTSTGWQCRAGAQSSQGPGSSSSCSCSTTPRAQPWCSRSNMSFTYVRRKEEQRRKEGAEGTSQLSLTVPPNYPQHYFFLSWITLNCKGGEEVRASCPDGTALTTRKRWKQRVVYQGSPYHRVVLTTLCHWLLMCERETVIGSPLIKVPGTWNDNNPRRGVSIVSDTP